MTDYEDFHTELRTFKASYEPDHGFGTGEFRYVSYVAHMVCWFLYLILRELRKQA